MRVYRYIAPFLFVPRSLVHLEAHGLDDPPGLSPVQCHSTALKRETEGSLHRLSDDVPRGSFTLGHKAFTGPSLFMPLNPSTRVPTIPPSLLLLLSWYPLLWSFEGGEGCSRVTFGATFMLTEKPGQTKERFPNDTPWMACAVVRQLCLCCNLCIDAWQFCHLSPDLYTLLKKHNRL